MFGRRKAPRDGVQSRQYYPQPMSEEKSPRLTWWYRFLLGRPMDGIRWTNSTFWRSATEGEDHWWLRLAGWHRMVIRLTVCWSLPMVVLPVLCLLGSLVFWDWDSLAVLAAQLIIAQLIALCPLLLLTDRWFRREYGVRWPMRTEITHDDGTVEKLSWRHWTLVCVREGRRTWDEELVRPVAAVAADVLDVPWHPSEASKWVSVPRDYLEPGGHPVEIMLPRNFAAGTAKQKRLLDAIAPRLGYLQGEYAASWLLKGRHPRLQLAAPPAPPEEALFADYAGMLAAAQEYRPFLGVTASGELLAAEMIADSPHIALSAGSGAGKSKMAATVIAQKLSMGWHVIILDWKVESHEWAKGLPGVTYVSDEQALHEMCERLGQEVDERRSLPPEQREQRARLLIVCEEWNVTAQLLSEYWSSYRAMSIAEARANGEQPPFMPLRSPALTGLAKVDFAGRSFGMFKFLVAQRLSARVFNGNADMRECYNIRLAARYTMQTWKMLTALKYVRKPSQLGRWVVIAGDEATQVQGILGTDAEWRDFAMGGKPNPPYPFGIDPGRTGIPAEPGDANGNDSQLQGQPAAALDDIDLALEDQLPLAVTTGSQIEGSELLKLVDLSSRLAYLGVSYKTIQHWRDNDPEFPETRGGSANRGWLYDSVEVSEFARRKRAAEAAKRGVKR